MEFIETLRFTDLLHRFGINDEIYLELQIELIKKPDKGKMNPETGGIRKIRMRKAGGGKRGGFRVLYYWKMNTNIIYMIYIFPKNAQADLSAAQKNILKALVKDI